MKKLLVVAVAVLVSASAFAQKSMVKLDGCLDNGRCDTLDFNMSGDDTKNNEKKGQVIALNYAHLFTDNIGAGLTYVTSSLTQDGDVKSNAENFTNVVISGYYNIAGGWASNFVALHLGTKTIADLDASGDKSGSKVSSTTLEYGHRVDLGSVWGINWLWSPSVSYAMNKTAPNADGQDDVNATELRLNVANFAMTF